MEQSIDIPFLKDRSNRKEHWEDSVQTKEYRDVEEYLRGQI